MFRFKTRSYLQNELICIIWPLNMNLMSSLTLSRAKKRCRSFPVMIIMLLLAMIVMLLLILTMMVMMMVTCETSADTRLERKTPAYNFSLSKSLQNDHQPPDDAFDAVVREGWDILVIFPVWVLTRDPLGKLFCHHLPVGRRWRRSKMSDRTSARQNHQTGQNYINIYDTNQISYVPWMYWTMSSGHTTMCIMWYLKQHFLHTCWRSKLEKEPVNQVSLYKKHRNKMTMGIFEEKGEHLNRPAASSSDTFSSWRMFLKSARECFIWDYLPSFLVDLLLEAPNFSFKTTEQRTNGQIRGF